MLGPNVGLRQVSTEVLKKLLGHVHREEIEFPLAPIPLAEEHDPGGRC